jgi:hypothetical protein
MRGTTCFQPDPGRRQPIEELPHLATSELTADNRLLVLIDAVHLKDMLGGIQANSDNRHGTAPLPALQTSQPGTTDAVGAVHPNITVSVVRGRCPDGEVAPKPAQFTSSRHRSWFSP